MNQARTTFVTVIIAAFALTLNVACSHSAAKDDAVHVDSSGNPTSSDGGFVETAQAGDTGQTLFQRLGGMKVLTDVSNKFVDALGKFPQITKNPKVAAAFAKDKSRFKDQLAIQLCELSDGPCKYKGKNMKDAHAGLDITHDEWSSMGKILIKVLRDAGVQKAERVELANRVARFKNDVVENGTNAAPSVAPAPKAAPMADVPTAAPADAAPADTAAPTDMPMDIAPSTGVELPLPPADNP